MTKVEMVCFLADNTHCSKADADKIIRTLPDMIKAGLENDGKVSIPGLGTFSARTRKARTGRNPKTGEVIEIPEKKVVSFKPAPSFAKSFGDDSE
ncbi:MAG: HU family DNA-binding protein [Proteobacteria bacterium]|nr:HU family DNA-binding protein [Pseudomonadota bacterium]